MRKKLKSLFLWEVFASGNFRFVLMIVLFVSFTELKVNRMWYWWKDMPMVLLRGPYLTYFFLCSLQTRSCFFFLFHFFFSFFFLYGRFRFLQLLEVLNDARIETYFDGSEIVVLPCFLTILSCLGSREMSFVVLRIKAVSEDPFYSKLVHSG